MAMLRYGHAAVSTPIVAPEKWLDKKTPASRIKVARNMIASYDPSKWLLSHVTIIASVDTEFADPKDKKSNYLIIPEHSQFVNNNGDCWERNLLLKTYKTFLNADNYVEHVQIPELSKGKVIDVALREVPLVKGPDGKDITTLYVDILIATNRSHTDLIEKITSGEYNATSMGCFLEGTEITMSDGTKTRIEDVRPGDYVITHLGRPRPVLNTQIREKKEKIYKISVEGDFKDIYVTKEHPFYGFSKKTKCACGCGEDLNCKIHGGSRNFEHSKYKQGHYLRIANPMKKDGRWNSKETPLREPIKLDWLEAKDLSVGDFLSYPISEEVIEDKNASVSFARFLGYFAAEGSYVKEVKIEGEENDYAVRCKVCGRLYNNLAGHLRVHGINTHKYKELYPNAKVKAIRDKSLIRGSSRTEDLSVYELKKSRMNVGLEFSLGEHEYNTVNKEIASLAKELFPESTVLRYKKAVKVIGKEPANIIKEYCGEYSDRKKFSEKVLFWDKKYQKHLIATWFIGDFACTVSKDMSDQFRYIFSRCRVRYNVWRKKQESYKCVLHQINGSYVTYEGMKKESYLHQINTRGMHAIKQELNYSFSFKNEKLNKEVHRTANSYASYDDGHFLRKITAIEEIPYEGLVYNMEVDEDNSYIANDVAVHNCLIAFSQCSKCGNIAADEPDLCKHVRYYKHNFFHDHNGIKRIIAELCFTPDHKVLMSNGSYINIEDVSIGDNVISHTGYSRKVLKTLEREYSGPVIKIRSEGVSKDITTTPEHPHYVYNSDSSTFCFKKSSEIKVGDFLVNTKVNVEQKSDESLNENRAFLLGLYAAEGWGGKSLNKDTYRVEFILNSEDEELLAEKVLTLLEKEFPPGYKKNGYKGSEKSWEKLLANKKKIKKSNAFLGTGIVCRSCGAPEEYLDKAYGGKKYRCKLCRSRAIVNVEDTLVKPKMYLFNRNKEYKIGDRVITNNSKKLVVSYFNKECYDFFKKYCPGRRSFNKYLSEKVLYASSEIQKQVLAGWLVGDGSVDSEYRLRGYTTSERLFRNFELIANRLNYWTRSQVLFDDSLIELGALRRNGDSLDTKGCHPRFVLYFSPRDSGDLVIDCGFCDEYPYKRKETRKINGYFLHKVLSVSEEQYSGLVYNLTVEEDNSYVVDGIVTHNCGRAEDPGSCKFVDASWVRKPAFEGAVLRNIVEPGDDVAEKIQTAIAVPSFKAEPGMLLRAASKSASTLMREITAQEGEGESAPTPPTDDVDFPPAGDEGGKPLDLDQPAEEAPAEGAPAEGDPGADLGGLGGGGDQPAPEPQIQEPAEDATVKEVEEMMRKQILNDIRRKMLKDEANQRVEESDRPLNSETEERDAIVREAGNKTQRLLTAAKRIGNPKLINGILILSNLKKGDWKSFKKYGYSRDDMLALLSFTDRNVSDFPVDMDMVKAMSRVKTANQDPTSFFTDIILETGRRPGVDHGKKMLRWAKILSAFE